MVLNGTASTDPDDDPLAFTWTQFSGPPVTLTDADKDSPQFTIEEPGTYRFQLVVNDGVDESEPDLVEVVVPYQEIDTGDTSCNTAPGMGLLGTGLALAGLLRRRR